MRSWEIKLPEEPESTKAEAAMDVGGEQLYIQHSKLGNDRVSLERTHRWTWRFNGTGLDIMIRRSAVETLPSRPSACSFTGG